MGAYVLFFGGYQATQNDIDVWSASAKLQKPSVTFDGYPWPPAAKNSDGETGIGAFKKSGGFDDAVGTIQECAGDRAYLVGHSSGCAIANAVHRALKDTSKVSLVALDGFAPDHEQMKWATTQVWAAECAGMPSLNHDKLQARVGARLKIYHATNCTTVWSLHFSLVNSASNNARVTSIATGYAQCQANLMWL